MTDFSGLFSFSGDINDCEVEEEEKVSRKRLREEDKYNENDSDNEEVKEVSDMFVCSGDGCYEKVLHVVESGVLPCPSRIDVEKYSRFVDGKLEIYDAKGVLDRLNKALYVDIGTKFGELCKYIMVDSILGDKNNAELLSDMLLKIFCGVLLVDMATVSIDEMETELKMDITKMKRVVTVLHEYMNPLENYKHMSAYNMIMSCWYSYVFMNNDMINVFSSICTKLKTVAQGNSVLYFDNQHGKELYSHIKAIAAWFTMRSSGFEKLMNLPSTAGEDLEILKTPFMDATDIMCSLLCSRGVIIIGNGSSSGDCMYSIPLYVRDVFTYTYSKPYKFGELLRELNVLDSYAHVFAQYGGYISRYFETTNVEKAVPYIDNKYFTTNRFISWRNGVFCCITGVFYYNEEGLRRSRMPANWPYTISRLKQMMGKNLILAMKYFDVDLLYDAYWITMILGEYRRRNGYVQSIDDSAVTFEDGISIVSDDGVMNMDQLWGSLSYAEKEYVTDELKNLDKNMHKPDYLRKFDPLDVRLRGAQKIVGDQRMPRGAYRILLEMFGRCFSGVIRSVYDSSNDMSNGPSFQYLMLSKYAKGVEDRMDIGTVLSGAARTGKSTLGDMIKYYFNGHHVGVMGDKERNINSFSTIVGKQVVMNLDLTTNMDVDKLPLKAPYVKKGITCEEIVQDELHSNFSKMIRFFIHFFFASNGQFPYPNVKMDMALRFAFFEFPLASKMNVGDTPINMFQTYDLQLMLVVCVMAHLRRLLNMKSKIFYSPPVYEDGNVFKIPEYLMKTQMNYIRDKDSVHAFIMEGCSARRLIVNSEEREYSIFKDVFLEWYKKYCKHHACEEQKESHVDEVLKKDFNVSMNEEIRTSYIGIKAL